MNATLLAAAARLVGCGLAPKRLAAAAFPGEMAVQASLFPLPVGHNFIFGMSIFTYTTGR